MASRRVPASAAAPRRTTPSCQSATWARAGSLSAARTELEKALGVDDRARLRRLGLPAHARSSCAVVGSADLFRLGPPRGQEIDAHDLVWRLNNAPTAAFERLVGARTPVRIINHVSLRKWNLLAGDPGALRGTPDGDEYMTSLCAPGAVERGCVVSAQGAGGQSSLSAAMERYHEGHPTHQLVQMSGALQRFGARCSSSLGGGAPSGGLLAVLLALLVCDGRVSLYGFWPFCCSPHRGLPRLHYKYSQGNRTAWVCCSRGRERMELEFAFYELLHRRGLVRLHTVPTLDDAPRNRSSMRTSSPKPSKSGSRSSHMRGVGGVPPRSSRRW